MTDRELLELAAKAAGYNIRGPMVVYNNYQIQDFSHIDNDWRNWNPLTDDGDALRLAVKLGISTLPYPVYSECERHSVIAKQRRKSDMLREDNPTEVIELLGDDPYAATRRAIVRAAAEIGKGIK
jgi:hypothetical protein